ncbi:hypothetical protein [Frigoriflavimonas asaccharolytica]|uniref:Outer membrane protein with beta-barrel domain n=1 Tax=Frigoriflavimonas asaccharolytica TaxID=2735899 RepID=A0A8J8K6M4_9FLAO|nr:hypothetical protein [Frigoriflavimonas asaccharolytica]NRS91113.1 hypothetical protein [Frigoriflavimonas asaccharolytica]
MKILISVLLFASSFIFAQIGTSTRLGGENSKWTFGGSAGLGGSFGNGGGTNIYVTPRVGYLVSENFETGLAGNLSWNNSQFVSSTIIGVGPFANYYFARTAYISTQFQQYFISSKDKFSNNKYSTEESALYLGGGYMQSLGNGIYMQIGAQYNVLYDAQTSIFNGGFVPNVGIVVGL